MRGRFTYTPEIAGKIIELIDKGYSTGEIAQELGIKWSSLNKYMCRHNLVCKPKIDKKIKHCNYPPELVQEWDALHNWYLEYRQRHPKHKESQVMDDDYLED